MLLLFGTEPQRYPEKVARGRRRRSDERDGLALSREIFRNISKQLRENIRREGALDNAEHLLQTEPRSRLFSLCSKKEPRLTSAYVEKCFVRSAVLFSSICMSEAQQTANLSSGIRKNEIYLTLFEFAMYRNITTSHGNDKVEDNRHSALHQGYHHHEHHWGPYFEDELGKSPEETVLVSVHVGSEALLNCKVVMLKDKTVMWVRRTTDLAQLLTVGPSPYAGDNRVSVKFQYPNNWRLSISPVKKSDEGLYMCQISTHPTRAILTNLTVLPPVLTINGDVSHEIKDRFYKAGSSIKLACSIIEEYQTSIPVTRPKTTPVPTTTTTPKPTTTEMTTKMSTVFNRIDLVLNKSWSVETTTITSTVSISTTTRSSYNTTIVPTTSPGTTVAPVVNNIYGLVWKKGDEIVEGVAYKNLSATINVASASQNDSGTYQCQLQNHSRVIVNVHVLIVQTKFCSTRQKIAHEEYGGRMPVIKKVMMVFPASGWKSTAETRSTY
ncbi:hypothetical protein EVAR_57659_1 [Eumeta japonica]|uniref:Ig-like domain-containing protein n=1 Tax=Eumeta variegata TaxID=151549 RepID=A0A4C1Z1D3_EUMVA|nr:hypothetical protein EVAR_57659_1 [Eumeta japonica]